MHHVITVLRTSLIRSRCVNTAQTANVPIVTGIAQAQYSANLSESFQPSEGMEKRAAKKVAGRKAMVRTAMVFIDDPSCRVASAKALLALAISMLILESSWVRNAKSYEMS